MDRLNHAGGVTGYEVERRQGTGCTTFTLLKTVTTTTTSNTGAHPQHHLQLPRPRQRRHPQIEWHRNTATTTTPAAADTTHRQPERPPATAAATTVNLSWTGSTDAGGVTGYEVEGCQGTGCTTFTLLKTVTTTTTSDTGLTPNTTYSYRVRAKTLPPTTATTATPPPRRPTPVAVRVAFPSSSWCKTPISRRLPWTAADSRTARP